jgi:peroxiredoxin
MLGVGDRIPEATVWAAPRETVSIDELVHEGPILLVFYLFDWSST